MTLKDETKMSLTVSVSSESGVKADDKRREVNSSVYEKVNVLNSKHVVFIKSWVSTCERIIFCWTYKNITIEDLVVTTIGNIDTEPIMIDSNNLTINEVWKNARIRSGDSSNQPD